MPSDPQAALAQANSVRSRLAADKRALKSGDLAFEKAARSHHWRNQSAMSLIGYAAVAITGRRWEGSRTPQPCGRTALLIAAGAGVSHYAVVAELTADQVSAIGRAIRQTGIAPARERATAPS